MMIRTALSQNQSDLIHFLRFPMPYLSSTLINNFSAQLFICSFWEWVKPTPQGLKPDFLSSPWHGWCHELKAWRVKALWDQIWLMADRKGAFRKCVLSIFSQWDCSNVQLFPDILSGDFFVPGINCPKLAMSLCSLSWRSGPWGNTSSLNCFPFFLDPVSFPHFGRLRFLLPKYSSNT